MNDLVVYYFIQDNRMIFSTDANMQKKIQTKKKMRYSYSNIKDYLDRDFPLSIRTLIIGLFIMLGIFGIPMIYLIDVCYAKKDFFSSYAIISVLMTVVFFIWGIIILLKKLKFQLLIFMGVNGVAISLLQMRLFYVMLYDVLKVGSIIFFYLAMLIYIIIVIWSFMWVDRSIRKGHFSSKSKKKNVNYLIILLFTFTGITVFRIFDVYSNQTIEHYIVSICLLLISYVTVLLSHGILKYYLLKKYNE